MPDHRLAEELAERVRDVVASRRPPQASASIRMPSCACWSSVAAAPRHRRRALCQKAELAEEVGRAGLDVKHTLCIGAGGLCEFAEKCRHLGQFRDKRPAIRIMAHAAMFVRRNKKLPYARPDRDRRILLESSDPGQASAPGARPADRDRTLAGAAAQGAEGQGQQLRKNRAAERSPRPKPAGKPKTARLTPSTSRSAPTAPSSTGATRARWLPPRTASWSRASSGAAARGRASSRAWTTPSSSGFGHPGKATSARRLAGSGICWRPSVTQHRCCLVLGQTSCRACQKPSAPSPVASSGSSTRPFSSRRRSSSSRQLWALSRAVLDRQQLLAPAGVGADQHQQALSLMLQPCREVHAVSPEIDVASLVEISPLPAFLLVLPALRQPPHRRRLESLLLSP